MSTQTPRSPCLLALETSTESCSVAVLLNGQVLEKRLDAVQGHSEHILPLIAAALAEAGAALTDLDAIAYGAGPGAFTGLRLGCGVAQGLAFGADLPVIAVGSLEAVAFAAGQPLVFACLDARMGEVYSAAFQVTARGVTPVLAPAVCPPGALDFAALPAGNWIGVGNGFAAYRQDLALRLARTGQGADQPVLQIIDDQARPTAGAVARLAALRLESTSDAASAQPLYVRDKVALTTAERLARGGKA